MDVSFIIPVYNDAKRAADCIASVLSQQCAVQFEAIVIDDGSDGATALALAGIKGVTLLRNDKNSGQSRSRNLGAASAKGKYLFFLDSDVALEPGVLAKAFSFMETKSAEDIRGVQGVFALQRDFNNWPSMVYNVLQHLLTVSPPLSSGVNASCFFIEKEAFRRIGGFNADLWYMEDDAFGRQAAGLNMAFARGIISFKHKKRLGLFWLLRQHFIGGIQFAHLNKAYPLKQALKYPYNRYFSANILKFILLLASLASTVFYPLCLLISLMVLLSYHKTFRALYKTCPNPFFAGFGFMALNIIPFVILSGIAWAGISGACLSPADRLLWLRSNLR